MKTQSVPKVNLPYASTVASFFGDQGAAQGNSFLGRMFKGGARPATQGAPAPISPSLSSMGSSGVRGN